MTVEIRPYKASICNKLTDCFVLWNNYTAQMLSHCIEEITIPIIFRTTEEAKEYCKEYHYELVNDNTGCTKTKQVQEANIRLWLNAAENAAEMAIVSLSEGNLDKVTENINTTLACLGALRFRLDLENKEK